MQQLNGLNGIHFFALYTDHFVLDDVRTYVPWKYS